MRTKRLIILAIVVIAIFSAGCNDKVNEEALSWNQKEMNIIAMV